MWTRLASACLMASVLCPPVWAGSPCGEDGECRDPLAGLEATDGGETPGPAGSPPGTLADPFETLADGDRQGVAAVAPPVLEGRVPQLAGTPTAQMPGMAPPQQASGGALPGNLPSAAPSAPAPVGGGFVSPTPPSAPSTPNPPQPFTIRLPFFGGLE